jgi:hypothetical protein
MDDLDTADTPSDDEISGASNLADLLGVTAEPSAEKPKAPDQIKTAPHADEDDEPAKAAAVDDDEEVDLGDVKLKLPKDQAEAVKKAALRQSDYTRKTMELAEQRKVAEGEFNAFRQQQAQAAQQLAQIRAQVEDAVNTGRIAPPDVALLESDPVAYLRQDAQWKQAQNAYNAARYQQEQLNQQQEHDRKQQHASRLQSEQEQLMAKLPDWKDAGKAQAEQAGIREYLQSAGFSADEIAKVQDHRGVLMAREAMLYRKMIAEQKTIAEKKVAAAPPRAIKPGATQDSATAPVNQSALKRLKASGGRDMQAAGTALASLLYGA